MSQRPEKVAEHFQEQKGKNCQIQIIHLETKSWENKEEIKTFSKTTATKTPRTFVTSMPKIFNYVLKIITQLHHFLFPSFTVLLAFIKFMASFIINCC